MTGISSRAICGHSSRTFSGHKTRIVTIGGGTGTFVVLSALKTLPGVSITAIVSSTDDGGSTGRLRDAYGFLPVGDARQALVALAEDGTLLRRLFTYRFERGDVRGHNLGNLFLTALTDLLGSEAAASTEAAHILRVSGSVVSATDRPAVLVATLEDGGTLRGEHTIDTRGAGARIASVALAGSTCVAPAAVRAITEADIIILGPGDLYTSTVAALLPRGMRRAIRASPARLVYFVNLFTKAGETDGYHASRFLDEIERYAGRRPDHIFVHRGAFVQEALRRYAREGSHPVVDDLPRRDHSIRRMPLAAVQESRRPPADAVRRSLIRHDPAKIARALRILISR